MKIAVIGSRGIVLRDLGVYLSKCDEIVSGGARGVDACAAEYARKNAIKLTEFLPDYGRYGRAAPIVRNKAIVEYADKVLAFWDGCSPGTRSVIEYAYRIGKPCEVILCSGEGRLPETGMK